MTIKPTMKVEGRIVMRRLSAFHDEVMQRVRPRRYKHFFHWRTTLNSTQIGRQPHWLGHGTKAIE